MKTSFPELDFISKHIDSFADEWFKIIRWILLVGTTKMIADKVNDPFLAFVPRLSVGVLWCYIFFGYSEKYFTRIEPSKHRILGSKIVYMSLSLVISTLLFIAAYKVADALSLLLKD